MSPLNRNEKGSQAFELSLVILPLLALIFVLLDVGWAVFAQSTLQRAARAGAHVGVTYTAANTNGSCLTDVVKSTVQANSFGLLSGSSGLALIKVHYLQPPDPSNTNGTYTDVSSQSTGNTPGNVIQVSVQSFSLVPLLPRIYGWNQTVDSTPTTVTVSASDLIEDSVNLACIGTAP